MTKDVIEISNKFTWFCVLAVSCYILECVMLFLAFVFFLSPFHCDYFQMFVANCPYRIYLAFEVPY